MYLQDIVHRPGVIIRQPVGDCTNRKFLRELWRDKRKTLVHTAQISPQQRRGEPVPQELLDRLLSAHAHWSQQQAKAKHQIKPPRAEATRMLL
ncbi:Telomere repeat-binding protein 5 [Nymphaea thermarum]|nr:Telomere repeat-binding protein 5 [Nymphaea thermarum]